MSGGIEQTGVAFEEASDAAVSIGVRAGPMAGQ